MRTAAALLGALIALSLGPPPAARGYVPPLAELYARLSERRPVVSRAILETRVTVYDPAARAQDDPAAELGEGLPVRPAVLPERGFRQRIYWIRDRLLAVQTLDGEGTPLHLYLDEGLGPISGDLAGGRHFDPLDVLHPYVPFMGATLHDWRDGLHRWGVFPERVRLERAAKERTRYVLEGRDGGAAVLERQGLGLRRIETTVRFGERRLPLSLAFGPAYIYGESEERADLLRFPRTVLVRLDGRLIKKIALVRLDYEPSLREFPLEALREQARGLAEAHPPSLLEHGIQ